MKYKNAFYLPSGRIFLLNADGYLIECTEMRDVTVGGKEHYEVRNSMDPHVIWKHLKPYEEKWLLTVSTQKGCPHGCHFCSPSGTPINTPYGEKPIEEINEGDYVIGHNEKDNSTQINNVDESTKRKYDGDLIVIELENGKVLRITPEHPLYTENRGWVEAQDITEVDILKDF